MSEESDNSEEIHRKHHKKHKKKTSNKEDAERDAVTESTSKRRKKNKHTSKEEEKYGKEKKSHNKDSANEKSSNKSRHKESPRKDNSTDEGRSSHRKHKRKDVNQDELDASMEGEEISSRKSHRREKVAEAEETHEYGSRKSAKEKEAGDEYSLINQKNIEALNKYNPLMSFLDLHIEPLKPILLNTKQYDMAYARWITGGTEFTRAILAVSLAFLEDRKFSSHSSLLDLVENFRKNYSLPDELVDSLKKLSDNELLEAMHKDNEVKNAIGDFMLRSMLKSRAVMSRWGEDVETVTLVEWEEMANVMGVDIEVYLNRGSTKKAYKAADNYQENNSMRFLVEDNAIGIFYTVEQARDAGCKTEADEIEAKNYKDRLNEKLMNEPKIDQETGSKLQSKKDYIEILETIVSQLRGKEKLKSLNEVKNQLDTQTFGTWEKLKMKAWNELDTLIDEHLKEETKSGNKRLCNICKKSPPSDKLYEIDCGHLIDMNCLRE
eukprot:TRINITY_DN14106_c0_g7_i1.p1 TRINITY_DN14106_c0_g7~~TRINITY_DN14106_c0_g7_i1.p1  ORF type:complete len:493 (+),score=91.92 TRINITY_DN14106_c0_g7_i1:163-1641(+)